MQDSMIPFLTKEQERRYWLAWNFVRMHFINGTGKVTNDVKVVAHYRAICDKILAQGHLQKEPEND